MRRPLHSVQSEKINHSSDSDTPSSFSSTSSTSTFPSPLPSPSSSPSPSPARIRYQRRRPTQRRSRFGSDTCDKLEKDDFIKAVRNMADLSVFMIKLSNENPEKLKKILETVHLFCIASVW
jgi:hypothetical protein